MARPKVKFMMKKITDETFTKDKKSASEKGRDFFNAEGKVSDP